MNARIKVVKDGPYLVSGSLPLEKEIIVTDPAQDCPVGWKKGEKFPPQETYGLCRCGCSSRKPYCDGSHITAKFDGSETAKNKPYMEQAETTRGPDLDLTDAESFCAVARFCHRAGDAWTLTENSNDSEKKAIAIQEACDCPSGRIVAWEKLANQPIEPGFEPAISVVEDPGKGASGPLWVRGGVPVESADGMEYEVRNRATLCRCGKSGNKPFCDGTHVKIKFNDSDPALNQP